LEHVSTKKVENFLANFPSDPSPVRKPPTRCQARRKGQAKPAGAARDAMISIPLPQFAEVLPETATRYE
jgi:hypothetical protein